MCPGGENMNGPHGENFGEYLPLLFLFENVEYPENADELDFLEISKGTRQFRRQGFIYSEMRVALQGCLLSAGS